MTGLRQQYVTVHGTVRGGTDAAVHLAGGGVLLVGETGKVLAGSSGVGVLVNDPGVAHVHVEGEVRGAEGEGAAAVHLTGGGSVRVSETGRVLANGADHAIRADDPDGDTPAAKVVLVLGTSVGVEDNDGVAREDVQSLLERVKGPITIENDDLRRRLVVALGGAAPGATLEGDVLNEDGTLGGPALDPQELFAAAVSAPSGARGRWRLPDPAAAKEVAAKEVADGGRIRLRRGGDEGRSSVPLVPGAALDAAGDERPSDLRGADVGGAGRQGRLGAGRGRGRQVEGGQLDATEGGRFEAAGERRLRPSPPRGACGDGLRDGRRRGGRRVGPRPARLGGDGAGGRGRSVGPRVGPACHDGIRRQLPCGRPGRGDVVRRGSGVGEQRPC